MSDLSKYRMLSSREQALVAVAVLLDGHDGGILLQSDQERHVVLAKAAADIASLNVEIRMPLLGTLLRRAIEHME